MSNNKIKDMRELAEFRRELYRKPRLKQLFFELTDRCNLSCRHCGSGCSPHNAVCLDKRLVYRALDDVKAAYGTDGILVCFTGGEPLLHPDFFEIINYADGLGFKWGMTTNATLIDAVAAEKIADAHMNSVSYSIDGTRDMHNFLRQSAFAFDKCVAGINNLQKYGDTFVSMVTTVVHKQNIGELDEIFGIVRGLGVDMWRLTNVDPIGNAAGSELLLDATEFKRLLDYIRARRREGGGTEVTYGCSHYLGEEYEGETRDGYFFCGAGIYICGVCCNGDIYGCLDIARQRKLIQGNIKRDGLVDIWEKKFEVFRQNKALNSAECKDCAEREFCAGDSAHTWDYTENRPKICFKKGEFNN